VSVGRRARFRVKKIKFRVCLHLQFSCATVLDIIFVAPAHQIDPLDDAVRKAAWYNGWRRVACKRSAASASRGTSTWDDKGRRDSQNIFY
jgi:hypothetical protein